MGFTDDINKFNRDFEKGADNTVRGSAIALFRSIIFGSPVDTGRFRANWFVSGENASNKRTSRTDKSGSQTINRMASDVENLRDIDVITLTNNLPYSEVIEFGGYPTGPNTTNGFSKQAPKGVVRVNVKRFQRIFEKLARKNT